MMKTAVIIGSTNNIGKEISEEFGENGYNVIMVDRDYSTVSAAAYELGFWNKGNYNPFVINRINQNEINNKFDKIIKKNGSIDILVNNISSTSEFGLDLNNIQEILGNNNQNINLFYNELPTKLKEIYFLSNIISNYMKLQGFGNIINIFSNNIGNTKSNTGILELTNEIAKSLNSYNVRVNSISSGYIDSELDNIFLDDKENYKILIPKKVFPDANAIAKASLILAKNNSFNLSGENMILGYAALLI